MKTKAYKKNNHIFIHYALFLFSLISLILLLTNIYTYYKDQAIFFKSMQRYASSVLDNAISSMNDNFSLLKAVGDNLATELNDGRLTPKNTEEILKKILETHKDISGISIIYESGQTLKDQDNYGIYLARNNEELSLYHIQKSDYKDKNWYQKVLTQGPLWIEPYLGSFSKKMTAEYALPFYTPENTLKPSGIIIVSYNLEKIQDFINSLPLGKTGYGFMIGKSGTYVAHPLKEYIYQGTTIFDKAQRKSDIKLSQIAQIALQQTQGSQEYKDSLSGKDAWIFFKQIPINQWPLFITFVNDETMDEHSAQTRSQIITILINAIIFLLFLSLFITQIFIHSTYALWIWSLFISSVFLMSIGALWYIQLYATQPSIDKEAIIVDSTGLEKFLSEKQYTNAIKIPTGIFIDYIKLSDLNQASIVGSLWQKYPSETPMLTKDFIFPLADETDKNIIVNNNYNNTNLIAWNFDTTLYQQFNYKKFPFDYKHIAIQIKPQDIKHALLLAPDIKAYTLTNPSSLPGINSRFKLANWHLIKSYFSYENTLSFTDHKIAEYLGESKVPQLVFNIILQRFFVHSFISYIIPLALALLFLFFVLRSTAIGIVEKPIKVDTILNPVALTISIFFAVILAHL